MMEIRTKIADDFEVAKKNNLKNVLTVTQTTNNPVSYLTPIRIIDQYMITGVVAKDSFDAIQLVKECIHNIDHIFVDIEKKIAPRLVNGHIDTGNFYSLLMSQFSEVVPIHPFRPNLLTINAVVEEVTKLLLIKKNLSVGVIGMGNIGTKVSQLLVETGFDVYGLSKRIGSREICISEAINNTKPKGTISDFKILDSLEKLSLRTDVVILCATEKNIINIENYKLFEKKHLLIDVGKGNINNKVAKESKNIKWLDIGSELKKYIISNLNQINENNKKKEKIKNNSEKYIYPGEIPKNKEKIYEYTGEYHYPIGEIKNDGNFHRFSLREIIELKK